MPNDWIPDEEEEMEASLEEAERPEEKALEALQTPWTSVDLYYKGVHIKKSIPSNVKIEVLKKTVDEYLNAGFQPSWNTETNKQNGHEEVKPAVQTMVCSTCGQLAELKSGISKTGKKWSGVFCSEDKTHVRWI